MELSLKINDTYLNQLGFQSLLSNDRGGEERRGDERVTHGGGGGGV